MYHVEYSNFIFSIKQISYVTTEITVIFKDICIEQSLVLLTSSRRLQDMFWRCLEDVLGVTISCLLRLLQTVVARRLQDDFKRSSRRCESREIATLRTSARHLQNMSWRRLEDLLKKYFFNNDNNVEDLFRVDALGFALTFLLN